MRIEAEQPLVLILVVVANNQVKSLKTEGGEGFRYQQRLDVGKSALSDKRDPFENFQLDKLCNKIKI